MRIKEEIKKLGYFWLPSTPNKRVPGTLTIADGGKIKLETIGYFDENPTLASTNRGFGEAVEEKMIVGQINPNTQVTLVTCCYRYYPELIFGSTAKLIVFAEKAFLGVTYDDQTLVLFNTFQFSVEGIDEWAGLSGIHVDRQFEKRSATIKYSFPEEIPLNLNNGMRLSVTFSCTLPGFPTTTEAKITHKTYFKLTSEQAIPVDNFISIARKITTLLCFAIDQIVCIEQISVTSNAICQDINGQSQPVPISLYYQDRPYAKDAPKIKWHGMLFMYPQIKENAEQIINKWLKIYDETSWGLNEYFLSKAGTSEYLEGLFLDLVQGLEAYHRRIADIESTSRERTLEQRIESIIKLFKVKKLFGEKEEQKKLVQRIADTRNYLIHYEENLAKKAAKGEELGQLYYKAEVIFQLYILHILNFTPEQIQFIVDNNNRMKQRLSKN